MYKRVLATVNEHLNSEITARYALHFAKRANAAIWFCSIAENGIGARGFQLAQDAIRRLSVHAAAMGIRAEGVLKTGDPLAQVNKIVLDEKIDLIFAATRHEDVEKRFYARTTARRLSLRLPCSVALVRVVNLGRVQPRNILVPLKARIDHVDERAAFTGVMASAFGSHIHILHTGKTAMRLLLEETLVTPMEWEEGRLPADILRFTKQLGRYDISPEKKFLPATGPARSITVEAAAKRHDMIIMGASERSMLNSFFTGNPVERVLREATCDLIILKPKTGSR